MTVVERQLVCPDCGGEMCFREPKGKYRARYVCERYPLCRGSHASEPDGTPLGIPANAETRAARIEAHDALEKIVELVGKARAYKWLATVLKLTVDECHIAKFDLDQCRKVVGAVNTYTRGWHK